MAKPQGGALLSWVRPPALERAPQARNRYSTNLHTSPQASNSTNGRSRWHFAALGEACHERSRHPVLSPFDLAIQGRQLHAGR